MKRIVIIFLLVIFSVVVNAQPIFNLGLKAGLNNSKVSLNVNDYNEESITKVHWGAFARIGISRVYLQPEVYFIKKGGEFKDFQSTMSSFDYNSVDVPVLLGVNILEGRNFNLHIHGGPLFGFVTKNDVKGADFNRDYIKDHYTGLQYGVGADILFLTLDLRMEHNSAIYDNSVFVGKNKTLMVTLGFKLL